jgi:hypothetical protein
MSLVSTTDSSLQGCAPECELRTSGLRKCDVADTSITVAKSEHVSCPLIHYHDMICSICCDHCRELLKDYQKVKKSETVDKMLECILNHSDSDDSDDSDEERNTYEEYMHYIQESKKIETIEVELEQGSEVNFEIDGMKAQIKQTSKPEDGKTTTVKISKTTSPIKSFEAFANTKRSRSLPTGANIINGIKRTTSIPIKLFTDEDFADDKTCDKRQRR